MNKLFLASLTVLAGAATAMAGVDPGLLNLVMPDAKILTGIQVDQSQASPFGQYVLSQMQFNNDPGFQKFMAATGFDPRSDLHEILAATSADSTAGAHTGLVLGRGNFQLAAIIAAATAGGATVTSYHGFNIVTGVHGGNQAGSQGGVVFLDASTAIMGDLSTVQATIDRNIAKTVFSGPLAQKANDVSAVNHAWFVTTTPLSEFLNGKIANPNLGAVTQSNLLQSILQASGGLNFGTTAITLTADAMTSSNQNAQALVDVLKFLTGMLQSNTQNNPAIGSLVNAASFTANGAVMHMSLSLPEQQAEQLFMPAAARAHHRAAVRH